MTTGVIGLTESIQRLQEIGDQIAIQESLYIRTIKHIPLSLCVFGSDLKIIECSNEFRNLLIADKERTIRGERIASLFRCEKPGMKEWEDILFNIPIGGVSDHEALSFPYADPECDIMQIDYHVLALLKDPAGYDSKDNRIYVLWHDLHETVKVTSFDAENNFKDLERWVRFP